MKNNFSVIALIILLLIGITAALGFMTTRDSLAVPALATLEVSAERGAYLARAGNCETCHTVEGGQRYAGGLPFHTPFGVLYSTNITPAPESGIGQWHFEDFYRSMRRGERPDGSHLYPAFPYTDFAGMTDDDIGSLWQFLQTLPEADVSPPENALSFPYNLRALLGPWKLLYHDQSPFSPDLEKTDEWNRGAYLVEVLGHCGACHTPRNALGAEIEQLAFTGGTYQDKVRFGYYRTWSGVNLTPHDTGLASWSEHDVVAYLRDGLNDKSVVHGPMTEVVQNSTSHLEDEDLRAMAVYLKALLPNAQPPAPAAGAKVLSQGEIIYTVHCGSCHLPSGTGEEGLGVTLHSNPIVQAADAASLINVILYGPHTPPMLVVPRSRMKMFGKRLSDADIAAVASYVRASFGNTAGAVSADEVYRQR